MGPPPYQDTRAAHRIIVPITSDHYLSCAFPDNDEVHRVNVTNLVVGCDRDCLDVSLDASNCFLSICGEVVEVELYPPTIYN